VGAESQVPSGCKRMGSGALSEQGAIPGEELLVQSEGGDEPGSSAPAWQWQMQSPV
jgi:hypothetical protein